ncbi:MAG TPA: DUF6080 domain-containing protein [Blastocatellia bacterium]|nr:DUF6080 domain-containing protein [Blastocatellia bacterium]
MKLSTRLVPIVIFVATFGLTYGVGKYYDDRHVLDQWNTLFDSDAPEYVDAFSNGWPKPSFRHPFGGMFFSTPIRAIGKVAATITGGDELRIRRDLCFLIVPFFEALKNLVLYLLLIRIGLNSWQAAIMCGLNLFALSTMTIGSIPESFPISSAAIVVFAWLMAREFGARERVPIWQWILAGSFAIGITITNIVPLLVFYLLGKRLGRTESWFSGLKQSAVLATLSLVCTFALSAVFAVAYSHGAKSLLPQSKRGDLGMRQNGDNPVEQLAIAAASTFVGIIPRDIVPNNIYVEKSFTPEERPSLLMMFTYSRQKLNNFQTLSWVLLYAGLLAIGGWLAYRQQGAWSAITLGSVALLVFNFTLHRFFYWNDMFLYAPHWQVPMLLLLAGLVFLKPRFALGPAVLAALAIASAVTSFQFLAEVGNAVKHLPSVY